MVSIGGVIGGAFRLFRDSPVALLIWWAIATGFAAASTFALGAFQQPEAVRMPGAMGSAIAMLLLFYLVMILVSVVQSAAAFRAVMRPDEGMAGFLRVGMDELRVFGMGALWVIALIVWYFLLAAFGVVIFRLILSGGPGIGPLGLVAIMLLLLSPIYGLAIWLHVRLSPALALTIRHRSFVIGEAWRITRGQFWRLFAAYAVIWLLIIAIYVALAVLLTGNYWAALLRGVSPAVAAMGAAEIGPLTIVGWFVNGAVSASIYAFWAGSVGTATQQLIHDDGQNYADTFA